MTGIVTAFTTSGPATQVGVAQFRAEQDLGAVGAAQPGVGGVQAGTVRRRDVLEDQEVAAVPVLPGQAPDHGGRLHVEVIPLGATRLSVRKGESPSAQRHA
jgi:hypothetical protein